MDDITVVELVETDPDPTLGLLSRSVSKNLQHVVCLIQSESVEFWTVSDDVTVVKSPDNTQMCH